MEGGGVRGLGRCVFSQWGRWERSYVQTISSIFLKMLTEGTATALGSRSKNSPGIEAAGDLMESAWNQNGTDIPVADR